MRRIATLVHALVAVLIASVSVSVTAQELKKPAPIGLMSKVYFEDEFEGDALADHWEVSNPDPEAYIVEDGVLLIIAKAVGGLGNEAIPNLFRLKTELPAGDWIATVELSAEFQTARDWLQFGLFSDPGRYVITSLFTKTSCCHTSWLTLRTKKQLGEQTTSFDREVWKQSLGMQAFADTVPQPITLKLIKKGRVYRSALSFAGQKTDAGEAVWLETDRVVLLRPPKQLVLNVSQWKEVKGESLFSIESVTITTSGE